LWSQEIKQNLIRKAQIKAYGNLRIMSATNKAKWSKWRQGCRDEARVEFSDLRDDPVFSAGLMLFWGEGEKSINSGLLRLVNSDPKMIKIFYLFLLRIGIPKEKISARLILYPDLDDKKYKTYWSRVLEIPLDRFIKSSIIQGKHPNRKLSLGICELYVCSMKMKEKVITWMDLYSEYLQQSFRI